MTVWFGKGTVLCRTGEITDAEFSIQDTLTFRVMMKTGEKKV